MSSGHYRMTESMVLSQSNHNKQQQQLTKTFKGQLILDNKIQPVQKSQNKNNHQMDFSKTGKPTVSNKVIAQKSKEGNYIPQDLTYMKYYEQNIKLKKKQQEMARQLQLMKSQLQQRAQVKRVQNQKELAMLAAGKKSLWDTKNQGSYNQRRSVPKNNEANKVSSLLEIIEHYKEKLCTAEQEIQNLKRQKYLLEQDTKLKQKKADQLLKDFGVPSTSHQNNADFAEKLQNTTRLLQIQKQKNKFNEADIRRLQTKIRTLEMKQDEIDDLKITNKNLEQKVLKLTQLPSFSHVTQKLDQQNKTKEAQEKYKMISQKYNQLKTQQVKMDAQIKVLRNELIKATYQIDQYEKQNTKLKAFSFQNPIIKDLADNQQLLGQVVYQIRNGKKKKQFQSQLQKQSYDKILKQKQMLANQLTLLRTKTNAMQQIWKEKQRISKIQKQQIINTFKDQIVNSTQSGAKVMSKNGVPYTEDISMFSQDAVNIPSNSNYFDLYLGELHLLQSMLSTSFNMRSPQTSLILATVDFYNHNTETSRPVHGVHCNLQSQFSFKVSQDQFFFKYLNKGNFVIQLWGSQGNKRINLGKATVELRPLVLKSRKNLAPVVSQSSPIYMNQRVMGSINFVMRMRLPIFDQLQAINQLQQIIDNEQKVTRKLVIQVQEGRGFAQNANTFVYFPFRLEDYYTKTYKGSNPAWNYYKVIQLKYNNDLKNYLRKNQLQFVILDDNAIITNQGDSDVIGSAYIPLVPLLESKTIKQRLTVMKGTQKVGQIDIKIYWQEQVDKQFKDLKKSSLNFAQQIRKYVLIKNYTTETTDNIFYAIDNNKTGMISFEQFFLWAQKINSNFTYEHINQVYRQFKQPVNLINFTAKINSYLQNPTSQIAEDFSKINKMFSLNTEMIKKKQSFQDFLKGKQIDDVSLDIDKTGDGKISKQEIKAYFDAHNIEITAQMVSGNQKVDIVKFIKKYQSLT